MSSINVVISAVGKHDVIYMNAEQLISIQTNEPIRLEGSSEPVQSFHAKIAWSQDSDGKYLEEVRMVKDVIGMAAWKDFPKKAWDIISPEISQFLMKHNISFNKKKLESPQ